MRGGGDRSCIAGKMGMMPAIPDCPIYPPSRCLWQRNWADIPVVCANARKTLITMEKVPTAPKCSTRCKAPAPRPRRGRERGSG